MCLNFHLMFWTFILTNTFLSYLVHSGCYNKYQIFKQKFISHSSRGWKSGCQRVIGRALFLLAEGVRGLCVVSFIRTPIPFMRAPPSWLKPLPKAPPPNTIHWASGFQHMNLGENTNVDHSTKIHSSCWVKLHFIHFHCYITNHFVSVPLFIHSLAAEYLCNFQLLVFFCFCFCFAFSNCAAMSIAFWFLYTNFSLGYIYLGVELMGFGYVSVQLCVIVPSLYSKWLYQFTILAISSIHIFPNTWDFLIFANEMGVKWCLILALLAYPWS